VTPVPILIVFVLPSIVTDELPIVRIPVILTSPITCRAYCGSVVPIPTFDVVTIPDGLASHLDVFSAVTVATPAARDTTKLSPKSIVAAVPTTER